MIQISKYLSPALKGASTSTL